MAGRDGSDAEVWTDVLGQLLTRAQRDGGLQGVSQAEGLTERIRKVQEVNGLRRKLAAWISQGSERTHGKSGGTATRLRNEGNLKFKHHDYPASLKLFTESVICAPAVGPELSLAFGNRSATLFHLGHFEACLRDIELAFQHRFPANLAYKLHQRRGQCHGQLGRLAEARAAFAEAQQALAHRSTAVVQSKASLAKDIQALAIEIESVASSPRPARLEPPQFEPDAAPHLPGGAPSLIRAQAPRVGRYVTTQSDLEVGAVVFSELPYACILLPDQYASHCHHCCQRLTAPIPCLRCTQPRYCSEACRLSSWDQYHRFECTNLDSLHSVGIAHLAWRTLLVTGHDALISCRPYLNPITLNPTSLFPPHAYRPVIDLEEHAQAMTPEDIFQYATTAVMLTMLLEQRTSFFPGSSGDVTTALGSIHIGSRAESGPTLASGDSVDYMGALLLKHMLQLVCNASAVFEVAETHPDDPGEVVQNMEQVRIASAIYCGASMMNHSCDPSVINSFFGHRLIVRTIKDVGRGQEIFNCYGPHFRRDPRRERMASLQSQYQFQCQCPPCSDPSADEAFHGRFWAFKCPKCSGPIPDLAMETELTDSKPIRERTCLKCQTPNDCTDQIGDAFLSLDLFNKGGGLMRRQDPRGAIDQWEQCLKLRRRSLHRDHKALLETLDSLAMAHAELGEFSSSANYIRQCLPTVEYRYGSFSIELGHELIKFSDVLQRVIMDKGVDADILKELKATLQRAAQILELHYGNWHSGYLSIQATIDQVEGCT
eukprot:maker-scaffold770_size100439-snap-gene-0.28 protein:Tk05394 transcript:maker-scaffold770_size100439-snap-gene-0.28-mRNA-1 annotation:"set and mynd domain-containing protein 4"